MTCRAASLCFKSSPSQINSGAPSRVGCQDLYLALVKSAGAFVATGVWLRRPRLPGLAAIIAHPNDLDSVQQRTLGKKRRTLLLISSLGMLFDQNIPEQLVKRKTVFFSPNCTDVQTGTSIFKDFTQMFLIKINENTFFNHYPLPKLASQVYTSNFYLRSQSNLYVS